MDVTFTASVHFWYERQDGSTQLFPDPAGGGRVDVNVWWTLRKELWNHDLKNPVVFDFGYVDQPTGNIIHANFEFNPLNPATGRGTYWPTEPVYADPNYFYTSTAAQWGNTGIDNRGRTWHGYRDFNQEVWCVQCPGSIYGKTPS